MLSIVYCCKQNSNFVLKIVQGLHNLEQLRGGRFISHRFLDNLSISNCAQCNNDDDHGYYTYCRLLTTSVVLMTCR